MRVRVRSQCDVVVDGVVKALFGGQAYNLPPDVARPLIERGQAESLESKAVEGPPEDKARKRSRNK